ncbi:MAG: cupin domain-containing protein [Steroidobacteraceae bacterium]|jgi:quercetin dioxygenase-like cupin family protein
MRKFMSALAAAAFVQSPSPAAHAGDGKPAPPDATVKELMTRAVVGVSGKEVRMLAVEYIPGGASLAHRHNAQVFVYVLEGAVKMQIAGGPELTLGPGETFYEGPEDIHTVSANASPTKPARILVFMIKDAAAPVSLPAVR